MLVDISLTALVALLSLGMAALGGHLAATKLWHKYFFWIAASVCVIAMSYQTYRSATIQGGNNDSLMKMQKETSALQTRLDSIWSLLNANPTTPEVQNKPSPRKPQSANTGPSVGVSPGSSALPSNAPLTTPENPPEYYGSAPHVNLPPSNGVLNIVSQTSQTSTRADAPVQTEIIVQTTVVWQSIKLALECNGDLVDGNASPSSGGMTVMTSQGLAQGHPNIFVYEYGSATPPFGPADPLKIEIWSKKPVSCNEVTTF